MSAEDPLLLRTDTGPTLHWRGVAFYPSGDPIEYARRKTRVFSPAPRSLILVPSIGLGHGLADLLARIPGTCAILCVEAFQEIMGIAMAQALPRDPRLTIIRTADPDVVAETLRRMGTGRFRRVVTVPLCAGYRLAPDLYERFRHRLEQEIMRHWRNRITLIAMGSLQVRTLLSNLPLLGGAMDFSALSSSLPAIVAAAGPSLEEALPSLERLRGRFLLIAVDTALPSLLASGIVPDVIVALEAQLANLQDFIPFRSGIPVLACDIVSHPTVARLFPGRLAFFSSTFAPLRLLDRLESAGLRPTAIPPLGSVGVAAVHAALRITRGDVYLTGLDFSFPDGRTHVRGSPYHLGMIAGARRFAPMGQAGFQALMGRPLLRVPDKNGKPVATDHVLHSYRDGLEQEARAGGLRVRDCGAVGLPLGVPRIVLEEMEERIGAGPAAAQGGLEIDPGRGFAAERLPGFLAAEMELLGRAISLGTAPRQGEAGGLLADIDYTWVHFPDEPDLDHPDQGFLARVRVAAAYYRQRLERMASVV
jgi:hypothetical protein